jgi:rSAM/selenodomain-associated transferase 2
LRISVIVPVLNEAAGIVATLASLQAVRPLGHEVVVVDGGSTDGTPQLAAPLADQVVSSAPGRAVQMNAGALATAGDSLLFLHADTRLPSGWPGLVSNALEARHWGRFDVALDSPRALLALVAFMMNARSRITGIATGDQAMFMTRAAFEAAGGFPNLALMEDVALSGRLRKIGPPACISNKATTSARRWERYGVLRTIMLMWRLRLLYFFGADTKRLARIYSQHS